MTVPDGQGVLNEATIRAHLRELRLTDVDDMDSLTRLGIEDAIAASHEVLRGRLIQAENALRETAEALDDISRAYPSQKQNQRARSALAQIEAGVSHSPEDDMSGGDPKSAVDVGAAGSPEGRT